MTQFRDFSFLKSFQEPIFMSIDGPNGCGKTTLIDEIKNQFIKLNIPFTLHSEPREGGFVRTQIVENKNPTITDPQKVMEAFMTEREQYILDYYLADLFAGNNILCSRHLLATLVYQGNIGKLGKDVINNWYARILTNSVLKDANFENRSFQLALNISEEEAIKRRNKRKKEGMELTDTLEAKAIIEINAYQETYFPSQINIDANGKPGHVAMLVANAVGNEALRRKKEGLLR